MALGADQQAARILIDWNLSWTAVIPCGNQDMSIYAAKRLREALETTAALVGDRQGTPLSVRDRRDQDPANFISR